jgi:hypothetical protein
VFTDSASTGAGIERDFVAYASFLFGFGFGTTEVMPFHKAAWGWVVDRAETERDFVAYADCLFGVWFSARLNSLVKKSHFVGGIAKGTPQGLKAALIIRGLRRG